MGSSAIFFVVCFFGALLLIFLVLISISASRATLENEAVLHEFDQKRSQARGQWEWIRTHTEQDWPIWPRPILFNAIDASTQLSLGRADIAYETVESTYGALKRLAPFPSGPAAVLNIFGNMQRLSVYDANKKQSAEFLKNCALVAEAYQTIRKNRKAVDALKQEVRRKVDRTTQDFNASAKNLQFFQRLGAVRYNDALKNIQYAQDCISHADLELASAAQEDLVEWAAADLLCFASLVSLSIFKLKGRSYAFSETFEADLVQDRLSDVSYKMESVLDYQDIHQWKRLVHLRNQFLRFSAELEQAAKSLEEFEGKVRAFNNLVIHLTGINVQELSQRTHQVESALAEYFGPPGASPDWDKTLYRYQLPSAILEEKRGQLTRDITPSIQGTIIKQSELAKINLTLEEFLKGIERVQLLIRRIEGVAQYQRQCEREVKQLLGQNGEIERLIRVIARILEDTADEIRRACTQYVNEFNDLTRIAFDDRRRTRFPLLLPAVREYKEECESIIARHEDLIKNLQDRASNYYRELNRLQTSLGDYQYRTPIIEVDWTAVNEGFNELMLMYAERGSSYTAISTFNDAAHRFMYENKSILRKLELLHAGYRQKVDEIRREIAAARKQIEQSTEALKRNWINPLSDYIQSLQAYDAEYSSFEHQLQSIENDLRMDEAYYWCRRISQQIAEYKAQQESLIQEAVSFKEELDQLTQYIERLQANKRLTENNLKAVSDANLCLFRAQNTYDLHEAKQQLHAARSILEHADLPAVSIPIRSIKTYEQDRYRKGE